MNPSDQFNDAELPSIHATESSGAQSSIFGTVFGGDQVERRPVMLSLAVSIIILVGFIVGTLFTLGILSGFIEIDPKAIKTVLKSLLGKS